MEGSVRIKYEDEEHLLDLEDLTAEKIGQAFELDFEVKCFLEDSTRKTVFLDKLRADGVYTIKKPKGQTQATETEEPKVEKLDSWAKANWRIIQHALVLSQSLYEDNAANFLRANFSEHYLSSILRSQHGDCHFILAEELETEGQPKHNRIYVAFRGSTETGDLTENLQIYPRAANSAAESGRFHSGFLSRAQLFPLQAVLSAKRFSGKQLVLCGHSSGGAVAAIVTTEILLGFQWKQGPNVAGVGPLCVTFGAPLFGDEAARKLLSGQQVAETFYHFVSEGDPVPSLLSLAQSATAVKHRMDDKIRKVVGEGAAFDELMKTKDRCVNLLSGLTPLVESALTVAKLLAPAHVGAGEAVLKTVKLISDAATSWGPQELRQVYMPIGNFLFMKKSRLQGSYLSTCDITEYQQVERKLDILASAGLNEGLAAHTLNNYQSAALRNSLYKRNNFPLEVDESVVNQGFDVVNVRTVPRTLEEIAEFGPVVLQDTPKLYVLKGENQLILRMVMIGRNLFSICIQDCQFNLGFPFGKEKAMVKRIPQGVDKEQLVIEQEIGSTSDLSISDYGAQIKIATQFGSCEFMLPMNSIQDVELQNVSQVSRHENISVLIRKSVQRSMALSQLSKGDLEEPLSKKITDLAELCLPEAEFKKYVELFRNESKDIQYILSNEEEYNKVNTFCEHIQDYMKNPLKIKAEGSILSKIAIGALAVLGAAAVVAGPGLLLIGLVMVESAIIVVGTMVIIGTATNAGLIWYLSQLAEQNYSKVLQWLTSELFRAFSARMKEEGKPDIIQKVSYLRDDDTVYSNEKAVIEMFDQALGIENFKGTDIEKSTKDSKDRVIQRITCIRIVHEIRNLLASQCFIGLVGIQDAGKSTLLNSIWGVEASTGYFSHTDVATLYPISDKIHIVDFPGSNSLDEYAKTFSICGAMNNMIILVIPFNGDVSQLVSEEVARVFEVMKGSESCRVLLCINKCGLYLRNLQQELKDEPSPVDFLKERYVSKLNSHFLDGTQVSKESILFTDWQLDEEGRAFGLEGIEEVKKRIQDYLVELHVVHRTNLTELEEAVSPAKKTF